MAKSEKQARQLIAKESEGSWLDSNIASCVEIQMNGSPKVISRVYND